jgi:hypothetical protein
MDEHLKPLSKIPAPIDLQNESLLGLAEAARRLPSYRRGRPVNPATIFRWIHDGIRLPSGRIVRLEAIRLGGRWLTSVEALQRFAAAQTPMLGAGPTHTVPSGPAARQRAAENAAKQLEELGI